MTVFNDFKALLETTGSKVFANKKLDTVKQAVVYKSIGEQIVGSQSGNSGLSIERVQVSCYAINIDSLHSMSKAVKTLLSFYDSGSLTSIPAQTKVEGYDEATSTYFVHEDFFLIYKE